MDLSESAIIVCRSRISGSEANAIKVDIASFSTSRERTLWSVRPATTSSVMSSPITIEIWAANGRCNPASNSTVFHYRLPIGEERGAITVFDLNGKMVAKLNLLDQIGSIEWDIKQVAEGIYIYQLSTEHSSVEAKRLVVTK